MAGIAAGTLVTAGLVGELALQHDAAAAGTTIPSSQATTPTSSVGSSSASSSSSSATSSSSSASKSYGSVPAVQNGGNGGSDSNSRGS